MAMKLAVNTNINRCNAEGSLLLNFEVVHGHVFFPDAAMNKNYFSVPY